MNAPALVALFALAGACSARPRVPEELFAIRPKPAVVEVDHLGPAVAAGEEGPGRFAALLYDAFDPASAMASATFVDGFYRAPANDGYESSLDHVRERLSAAGFGARDGLLLEEIHSPQESPAWTPISAKLELEVAGRARVLHAFDSAEDRDRTMLPVGAPSGRAEGTIALSLAQVRGGEVLVVSGESHVDARAAAQAGAVALVVHSLEDYNVDPTPRQRHLDAIQFRGIREGAPIPVLQISRNSLDAIHAAVEADPASRLRVEAEVRRDARPLRTLVATVLGADRPQECVVAVAHVQEPGAVDNASGVGGIAELACAIASALDRDLAPMPRPSRSVVFVFGDEMEQSRLWLAENRRTTIAAISADMIGADRELTGARALLERGPDPGAVRLLPPDEHTAWGSSRVEFDELEPHGWNVVARMAMADVAQHSGGWSSAEHPYEGGSDHDVFLRAKIPALLLWHFTDFAYHTSLDRIEHVDAAELRRMSCAIGAALLAMADPRPSDLDRYLRSNQLEQRLRTNAARDAGDEELALQWERWCTGARHWLRRECLRLSATELPRAPR